MARIAPVSHPQGKAAELLKGIKQATGGTPNIFTTLAHSPAALEAFLKCSQSLGGTSIPEKLREQIALTVAGANSCQYCASAHTLLGKKAGIPEVELSINLAGTSNDQKTQAALNFAKTIVTKHGRVSNDELKEIHKAGYSDGEIIEILAVTTLNIFTNYFNHMVETDIDFPVVKLPGAKVVAKV